MPTRQLQPIVHAPANAAVTAPAHKSSISTSRAWLGFVMGWRGGGCTRLCMHQPQPLSLLLQRSVIFQYKLCLTLVCDRLVCRQRELNLCAASWDLGSNADRSLMMVIVVLDSLAQEHVEVLMEDAH